jgi:membrane protein YdbS with pleckstrin-like domain
MRNLLVRPEKAQRTLWFIHWSLVFFPVFIPCFVLIFIVNQLAFAICTAAWAVSMLPFLFWIPAYFRSLGYSITEDVVKGQKGVFWKRFATVPYHKITNVDITQGPLQRKYNVGTIHCQTAGAGGQQGATAELKIEGIRDLEGVKEAILQRALISAGTTAQVTTREAEEVASSDGLSGMLKELTAIRELLEKQAAR